MKTMPTTNVRWRFAVAACCVGVAVWSARGERISAQVGTTGQDVRVTVIGCVRRSEPPAATAPSTTANLEGQTKYVLSNITLAEEPGVPGSAASALVAQNVKSYRLDDSEEALIAPRVGQRVQVSGVIVASASAPAGTSGSASPTSESRLAPKLRVESMQTISSNSATCAQ